MKTPIAEARPAVSKIRIEYADGSHDDMELLDERQVLYSWDRKTASGKKGGGGLYTANRMSALVFKTTLEGRLAPDQFITEKQAKLLNAYIKSESPLADSENI
jgi:hypothetical protein